MGEMSDASGARMVGRGDHLRVLHAALARVAEGHPAAVLVSGELGVGKTRLAREFLGSIEAEVFAGACVPVVGEPLPYAALTQALRGGSALVRQEVARFPELASCYPAAAPGPVASRSLPAPSTGPRRDSGSSKRC
jgi:hypothetical protein